MSAAACAPPPLATAPESRSQARLQMEIGRRVVACLRDRDIALDMDLSEEEVARHVQRLMARTGTGNRSELAEAWPMDELGDTVDPVDAFARMQLLRLERNAYRSRCRSLQQTLDYLLGRPVTEPGAAERIAELEVERDALLLLLAQHPAAERGPPAPAR